MRFRWLQIILGVPMAALAVWLVWWGIADFAGVAPLPGWEAPLGGDILGPAIKLVGGLAVLGVFYWGLVSSSPVRRVLENIFAIPELLRKLGFTLGLLCIYRIGFHVPLPGLDQQKVAEVLQKQASSVFGQALAYLSMFTGGNLQQSTLFGLGIMPYISASIIMQLLATVLPSLEKLQKEGPAGYKKIQEYTRYLTVVLCLFQATVWMRFMASRDMLYPEASGTATFLVGIIGMTTGTLFLMWLGEQIDEYGIGNGISLLIMAGIVARMPTAIVQLSQNATLDITTANENAIGPVKLVMLAAMFVFVIAGAILITQAQRRIPIQQAKHTRGRRVYGGQRHYMPLRVNHGGVMPIIFASSLMIIPGVIFNWLGSAFIGSGWLPRTFRLLSGAFQRGEFTYSVVYIILIVFFAYFWTTVQFRPKEMAEQLRDQGHFIPGLRPGKRTADYLERVMSRITYCGAAFLAIVAVTPTVIASWMNIPFSVSAFLGGTGLLIMVSVALDLVQRIEANLVMRNYGGFLGGSSRIKGPRG